MGKHPKPGRGEGVQIHTWGHRPRQIGGAREGLGQEPADLFASLRLAELALSGVAGGDI